MAKAHGTEHRRPVLPAGSPARSLVSDTVWAPPFAAAGPTARHTEVPAVLGEAKIGVQKNTILNSWHCRLAPTRRPERRSDQEPLDLSLLAMRCQTG